jgi:uncharacterized protein (TIGR03084 family)
MLKQAVDLREEGNALYALLETLGPTDWGRNTPFKNWTVNDVLVHLHASDRLAVLSLQDPAGFKAQMRGNSRAEEPYEMPAGAALVQRWREYFEEMCRLLGNADPTLRLPWVGPDMGVKMFTTARQMETWAHGQDIYDLMKAERTHTDRIKNIAFIGVRTFGWTFANRGLPIPDAVPYVRLKAPSGVIWEWNEPSGPNRVEGSAVEFCHVVTQGRNIADCNLTVEGVAATRWMAIAQCFAGGPEDPPKAGARTWG